MPLDVIMPALGMAQESGVIVSWHKKPGDAVAEGDVLFEVETDKATMEVEAQGSGFLSAVSAGEGDEVPVGQVIARIADTADQVTDAAASGTSDAVEAPAEAPSLPAGQSVIMPTLGMAQDSGLLVGWLVEPGAKISADDALFEVETDKSTMEVPAGADGYVAALLAQPGEDVPTGQVIAIISPEPPQTPLVRSASEGGQVSQPPAPQEAPQLVPQPAAKAQPAQAAQRPAPQPEPAASGRVLASPKARRLALEQGLDLTRLAAAGHPQPFHVRDLDTLRLLPAAAAPAEGPAPATASAQGRHLTADLPHEAFSSFCQWAADNADLHDVPALLAGFAGGCLDKDVAIITYEVLGQRRVFEVPRGPLYLVTEADGGAPDLVLRDLRHTRVTSLHLGADGVPALSIVSAGPGLSLTLECGPDHLSAEAALSLLSEFAGRLEQPLRHLL